MDDYITKPVRMETLAAALDQGDGLASTGGIGPQDVAPSA